LRIAFTGFGRGEQIAGERLHQIGLLRRRVFGLVSFQVGPRGFQRSGEQLVCFGIESADWPQRRER